LETVAAIREAIEAEDGNRVEDLHVWCVGPSCMAAVVSVATPKPKPPAHYQGLLADFDFLAHVTVEVHGNERVSSP
jgi:hypothetical protein